MAILALAGGLAACGGRAGPDLAPTLTSAPTANPTSTPTPLPSGKSTSASNGVLGPYSYLKITNTNGYNTYVGNNMLAVGELGMTQTLTAADPGNWYVVARAPAGNTSVLSYPNTQQLFNNWDGSGWNGSGTKTDTPIKQLKQLRSFFAENMNATPGTDAEAAYGVWLSGTSGPKKIMIWIDNANRGTGSAKPIGTATFGGQKWILLRYSDELIWSLNTNEQSGNTNEQSGTIRILAMLRDLQSRRLVSSGAAVSQINFGFEICSTGGVPETFSVSHYSLTAKPRSDV